MTTRGTARSRRACAGFTRAICTYLEDLHVRRQTETTARTARRVLLELRSFLRKHGVRELRAVSEAHLVAFAREIGSRRRRGTRPLAPATRANYLGVVRRFFAFLVKRGMLLLDPTAALVVPRYETLPRTVLSEAEAQRLMNGPSPYSQLGKRDRAALELLYGTGIRRSECVRLDVSDVDLHQERLLIRDGKGRQDRMVPLPGRAKAALVTYLDEVRPEFLKDPGERALFVGLSRRATGRRLSPARVNRIVAQAAARAGLRRRVHAHALRHACASHLLSGGAAVRHVQELLGHQQLRSTEVYTRLTPLHLAEAIARAHPREKRGRKAK
jgi:integrase/recombinase XerD